jgi:hypothetical protein
MKNLRRHSNATEIFNESSADGHSMAMGDKRAARTHMCEAEPKHAVHHAAISFQKSLYKK